MKNLVIILMTTTLFAFSQNTSKNTNSTNIKNTETMEKLAKQEIENLLMAYMETLNTSNAEKATSLYTKDGAFMPSGAPTAIGTENIKRAYDFVFSQIQLNLEFYIEEITIENTMAYAVTSSKGSTLIHANGETIPEENRELFVFEKENDTWKIARYMFNKTK
ncbi:nuclear transport factor 2 family protein [Yeosuana sp. MJ-SS3]|uniref:Nuclear transport factor 2 family protein n=1 Tax=Gilvirhabdus luticola TaxID=3079858 RepID=A0ABU3UA53_9FLAO|nr:nuclear transport factor 2 family protein [Yeosuana sp. MJ-SS3]MDU8887289.1 nuclear transport factor 2 family protein [Yeosuana sp. MJ-SS3]